MRSQRPQRLASVRAYEFFQDAYNKIQTPLFASDCFTAHSFIIKLPFASHKIFKGTKNVGMQMCRQLLVRGRQLFSSCSCIVFN